MSCTLNESALARRMEAVTAASVAHGTCPELVMGRSQLHPVRAARKAAMMAMRERFDDPIHVIGAFFGRSRRQVQYCIAAEAGHGRDCPDAMEIVEAVAEARGFRAAEVLHCTSRRPAILAARRAAICAAFEALGGTPAGLAAALGIDQTTVRLHLRSGEAAHG
jgi:predicted transcriptional regulator